MPETHGGSKRSEQDHLVCIMRCLVFIWKGFCSPLGTRSKSSRVIDLNWCLCSQIDPLLHQSGSWAVTNCPDLWFIRLSLSNWKIMLPQRLGLGLSLKLFLPCTIWWDKCNGISIIECAWVVCHSSNDALPFPEQVEMPCWCTMKRERSKGEKIPLDLCSLYPRSEVETL